VAGGARLDATGTASRVEPLCLRRGRQERRVSMADVALGPVRTRVRPSRSSGAVRRRTGGRVAGWWGLWLVLGVGAALRVADLLSYPRALMLWGDSYVYLNDAARLHPSGQHPLGYPLFLRHCARSVR